MSRKRIINQEVEKTMALLGSESPMKADSYFFTRLEVRIREEEAAHHLQLSTPWQRWRPVVLAGLIGVNIITAALWLTAGSASSKREQALIVMSQDYALAEESGDWFYESVGE